MDIRNSDFNGVDPKTRRPISSGHPDGVWVISILLVILSLFSMGQVAIDVLAGNLRDVATYITAFFSTLLCCLYLSIVYALFRRSAAVIYLISILCFLNGVILGFSVLLNLGGTLVLVLSVGFDVCVLMYCLGLKKDAFLE